MLYFDESARYAACFNNKADLNLEIAATTTSSHVTSLLMSHYSHEWRKTLERIAVKITSKHHLCSFCLPNQTDTYYLNWETVTQFEYNHRKRRTSACTKPTDSLLLEEQTPKNLFRLAAKGNDNKKTVHSFRVPRIKCCFCYLSTKNEYI